MKKILFTGLVILMMVAGVNLSAQNFDYHLDESPAISWNGSGFYDARLVSLAGISLFASETFAPFLNPALISEDKDLQIGLSMAILRFSTYQYWGINQGVQTLEQVPAQNKYSLGGFSFSFGLKAIRFSAGWVKTNLLQRPEFEFLYDYTYDQNYNFSGEFSGNENSYFIASAINLGSRFDFGIKLDYTVGNRKVVLNELREFYYLINNVWVLQHWSLVHSEEHRASRFNISLGGKLLAASNFTVAAYITMPFSGKETRNRSLVFQNSDQGLNFEIPGSGEDVVGWPWKLSLGAVYMIPLSPESLSSRSLSLGTELRYISWSDYNYIFFDETLPRDFRNVVIYSLAAEYKITKPGKCKYFSIGFKYDPQPLRDPSGSLKFLSAGAGVQINKIFADIGFAYIFGSFGDKTLSHFIINTSFRLKL